MKGQLGAGSSSPFSSGGSRKADGAGVTSFPPPSAGKGADGGVGGTPFRLLRGGGGFLVRCKLAFPLTSLAFFLRTKTVERKRSFKRGMTTRSLLLFLGGG